MAEIGRWGGHKFEVSNNVVRGFTGLQIRGSSEMEDKETEEQKYVSKKSSKPTEVSMTIHLNASLGCDVRTEALAFVDEATAGKTDYFYMGSKKLVTCQLMLTEATVKEIGLVNNGTWTQADVQITMKQCDKNNGTTNTSFDGYSKLTGTDSKGSKKAFIKTTSTTTTQSTSLTQQIYNGVKNVATQFTNGVKNGISTVMNALTGKSTDASAISSAVRAGISAVGLVTTVAKTASTMHKLFNKK